MRPESHGCLGSAETSRRIRGLGPSYRSNGARHSHGRYHELGNIVVGALAHPEQAGHGEYLPLVGDFMSFNEIVVTLNRRGYRFSFKQVSREFFAGSFPGAAEVGATFTYFQAHTYLGADSRDRIALANEIAGRKPTKFSAWVRANFATQAAASLV
jgi:hypothetical protein